MKIAWYIENPGMVRMTELCAASIKRHMPGIELVQMSPAGSPAASQKAQGVHTLLITPNEGHFFARRVTANAMLEGEVLFPDSDMIFKDDVSYMFARHAFDVALPRIKDPDVEYSAGCVFSRGPAFWQAQAAMQLRLTDEGLPWTKDLLAFFSKFVHEYKKTHHVLDLSESVYERVPLDADDPCFGAAIVHYRGPRKKWMPGYTGWPIETVFHNF